MRYISLDPGLATGVAISDRGHLVLKEIEYPEIYDFIDGIEEKDIIIFEKWVARPGGHKMTRQYEAPKIIGALEAQARKTGAKIVGQLVGDAKTFTTDTQLRQKKLYTPGTKHANDALKHLILYAARQRLDFDWNIIK